jgi:hypothetical protein
MAASLPPAHKQPSINDRRVSSPLELLDDLVERCHGEDVSAGWGLIGPSRDETCLQARLVCALAVYVDPATNGVCSGRDPSLRQAS